MSEEIVGIDLGTTYSLVAAVLDGRPTVLSYRGQKLLPSVVGLGNSGELLVGTPARNQYVVAPERTVKSIKRKMGSAKLVQLGDREYSPPEISAFILRELKRRAESVLGQPVSRAVITVPARFSDAQRQATKDAGEIAGLEVVRIINEPTAAALAYGLQRSDAQRALVYDLGGGTFDVSAIEMSDGIVEVRASHGDPNLGGDDFDTLLAERLAESVARRYKVKPLEDRRAAARLAQAAEGAKITLSDAPYATVREEHLLKRVHVEEQVSREEFEELIRRLLGRTIHAVDRALADAGWKPKDLEDVLLVGGSTRIPLVRQLVSRHLGVEPRSEIHPDEAVALGAAVQAAIIAGEPIDAILVDVCPYSLGIKTLSFTLGVTVGNRFSVVIPRNTAVPCSKTERFYTLHPDQDKALIEVYQGEGYTVDRNTHLGEFEFSGISPNPNGGVREVLVAFDYDIDGIVRVSARDRHTGRQANIKVTGLKDRLSVEEKAQARAALEQAPEAVSDATAILRQRAENVLARLQKEGKSDAAAELAALLAELDGTGDAGADGAVVDRLVDWIYEHEEV
ncbi:MAG: Hsp70 family protein [Chloroflexi bacterium]|nr:Hsp70 family protein [Chloroflexota bacterium]